MMAVGDARLRAGDALTGPGDEGLAGNNTLSCS